MKAKWTQVIPTIVETMLPRFSDPELCLAMIIDNRYNCYSEERHDDGEAELITLVFHRPHNYTKVFVRVTDFIPNEPDGFEPFNFVKCWGDNKEFKFFLHSDHDSCWRSDGLRIFSQRWQHNYDKMEKRGCNRKNISIFSSFSIFGGQPRYLLMDTLSVKRENGEGYLQVRKPLTIQEAAPLLGVNR